MTIAYLINVYPRPNQTFIRREIAALEARGIVVHRFGLRRWTQDVDAADTREREKTRYILDAGVMGILLAVLGTLIAHPIRFARGLKLTTKIGRRSERGL